MRRLRAVGVGFLAGCDGLVPGFCLHDELEWMTNAGLTPLEALRTATVNPAAFLGRQASQGTVEPGKRADLVLLDADPLADIRHTRRIAAVIVRGRLLDRPALDRIVASHRRAN
jgi:imidazolonepropionase-like amidohydrolase